MICRSALYRLSTFSIQLLPDRRNINRNPRKYVISCFRWNEIKLFHTSLANFKKKKFGEEERLKIQKKASLQEEIRKKKLEQILNVWEPMTVKEVTKVFNCNAETISRILPNLNNETLYKKDIIQVAKMLQKNCEFLKNPNFIVHKEKEKKLFERQPPPKPENLVKRPPVVTVMGHVDHGKTTLLDSLRNTFVVDQEFGGITQHIGAFSVKVKSGQKITFIDTPGHAAFTTMRARGAEVTDMVVLVIAADDGVMEQTIESIRIAKRAHVKIIVAINKIDKPKALSIDLIKEKLFMEGIQVEDMGGDVQLVSISALKKINLDLLVEVILLEAEVMNLKGDPTGLVEGVVIESKVDNFLGPVATVIVKRGKLKKGKVLLGGKSYAKVKSLKDENGKECAEALPSTPVQILGWKDLPEAGNEVFEVESEQKANLIVKLRKKAEIEKKQNEEFDVIREKAESDKEKIRRQNLEVKLLGSFIEKKNYWFKKYRTERDFSETRTKPSLKVILKGDVHGTLEVMLEILGSYDKNDECELDIVDASVGNVIEKDLELSETFDAIIYAFNVNLHSQIKEVVKEKQIDIRMHNVIYKMVEDIKLELNSRIPPKDGEKVLGEAEVNQNFLINVKRKKVPVAGCRCTMGELKKDALYRVLRNGEVVYTGKLVSMKHHKSEVSTIKTNIECGLMMNSFPGNYEINDKIVCYEMVKIPQVTSWNPGF